MTPDQINAAIARTVMSAKDICDCGIHWKQSDGKSCGNSVSNFHGSLDAIVPVVRDLPEEELELVWDNLQFSVMRSQATCFCALATPAQWCEAYLKAKGLWE